MFYNNRIRSLEYSMEQLKQNLNSHSLRILAMEEKMHDVNLAIKDILHTLEEKKHGQEQQADRDAVPVRKE